jgi:hypothetical protein
MEQVFADLGNRKLDGGGVFKDAQQESVESGGCTLCCGVGLTS